MKSTLVILFAVGLQSISAYLRVQDKSLYYNEDKVFLSGANVAWCNYGRDFGSGGYAAVKLTYESYIDAVAAAGGNVIRVWVHVDGSWSPKFDASGTVTGEDTESLIDELGQLLDYAGKKNVFVIVTLWNLAVKPEKMIHLYTDQEKLQSYLDKVLKPLAAGLKEKRALAAYDIINEPMGGMAQHVEDSNPCFDTTNLDGSGADWSGCKLNAKDILRFINWHIDVIKAADPKALVTVGDNEVTTCYICNKYRDYYSDECLFAAGGKTNGKIDFYQMHSYAPGGRTFSEGSPFKKTFADYNSSKPIIVGEFSTSCSETHNATQNYQYLYNSLYSGALSWQCNNGGDCADSKELIDEGIRSIKDFTNNGKIVIKL